MNEYYRNSELIEGLENVLFQINDDFILQKDLERQKANKESFLRALCDERNLSVLTKNKRFLLSKNASTDLNALEAKIILLKREIVKDINIFDEISSQIVDRNLIVSESLRKFYQKTTRKINSFIIKEGYLSSNGHIITQFEEQDLNDNNAFAKLFAQNFKMYEDENEKEF